MIERAIIVGLNNNKTKYFDESMEELNNLCTACDIKVVGQIIQKSRTVNNSYFIGTGKADELKEMVSEHSADLIVFNHELSLTQIRNLEKLMDIDVIDRNALILNIFSRRAKSREAKLQVEVAKLQYELPRLSHTESNLGRQGGGVGTKNRGSGEMKMELDRRRIEEKINSLNKELELIHMQRGTQSNLREQADIKRVALVGYTNAGKSTVMNTLLMRSKQNENKKVFQEDMLFATLDTSTRKIRVEGYQEFLLSDTVGFVGNLPHSLVKAFRSTLQEVCEAQLLLHVIDISNPGWEQQRDVTERTIKEIGAGDIPVLHIYNKIDKLENYQVMEDGVYISAELGLGIEDLLNEIKSRLFRDYVKCRILLPYTMGGELSSLMNRVSVIQLEHREDGVMLCMECTQEEKSRYKSYEVAGI